MWLFTSPKSYNQMHKKITWTTFIIVLIGFIVFTPLTFVFSRFMRVISFGVVLELGIIKFYLADIYLPLLLLLAELIFKLHSKISDLFKIKFQFDKNYIISRFLKKLKMSAKIKNFDKNNRSPVMNEIYYKYNDLSNPAIDKKLIYNELHSFSWFWITVDLMVALTVTGLTILVLRYTFLKLLIILGGFLALYIIAYIIYYFACRKAAFKEVEAILKSNDRSKDISRYLTTALARKK